MTEPGMGSGEPDLEEPEADAAEQRRGLLDEAGQAGPDEVPLDADEADAAEQSRAVELDDDEYR